MPPRGIPRGAPEPFNMIFCGRATYGPPAPDTGILLRAPIAGVDCNGGRYNLVSCPIPEEEGQ